MMQTHHQSDKREEFKCQEVHQLIAQMLNNKLINESERNYLMEAYLSENEGIVNYYKNYCKTKDKAKLEERFLLFLGKKSPKKNNFNPELIIASKPIHEKYNHGRTHSESFARPRLEEKKNNKTPDETKKNCSFGTIPSTNDRILSSLKNKKTVNSNYLISQIYNEEVFFQKMNNFVERHLGTELNVKQIKSLQSLRGLIEKKLAFHDSDGNDESIIV